MNRARTIRRHLLRGGWILLAPLLFSGCDPAISLTPADEEADWTGTKRWSRTFGDLEVSSSQIGRLVGCQWMDIPVILTNKGIHSIVLRNPRLLVEGKTYSGHFFGLRSDSVELDPGDHHDVTFQWDLDGPIGTVCAAGCTVLFAIEGAGAKSEARIVLRRVNE